MRRHGFLPEGHLAPDVMDRSVREMDVTSRPGAAGWKRQQYEEDSSSRIENDCG